MTARAIRSPARRPRRSARILKCTSYRDYLIQVLRLQRGGGELLPGPHARLLRARLRRGAGGRRARPRLSGLRRPRACRRESSRGARALHLSFPRRQRLACAAAGARAASRTWRPAAPWRTWCWRRSTTASSTATGRTSASGSNSTCVDVRNDGDTRARRLCARAACRTASRPARGARLLPHGDPAHHAGAAGAAARGARAERQDADRLHQCADAQLASRGCGWACTTSPRRCRFTARVKLDFPGQPRRLPASARPVRAHVPAPRARCRARPTTGSMRGRSSASARAKLLKMTFADFEVRIRDELDRMLGPGGFSSARDIAAITVNRWPHGYGYVANSLFDGDDYDERAGAGAAARGPGCHRQFRRRRRRLRASRDRTGRARGARTAGELIGKPSRARACRITAPSPPAPAAELPAGTSQTAEQCDHVLRRHRIDVESGGCASARNSGSFSVAASASRSAFSRLAGIPGGPASGRLSRSWRKCTSSTARSSSVLA